MKAGAVCWFEIPVADLDRAIRFYTALLHVTFEKIMILDKENGIFKKETHGIGGVLVHKEGHHPGRGIQLFFNVIALSDALEQAVAMGGSVITPKTLIRQVDRKGNLVIARNLIDDDTGYYAEIADSEGNCLGLYANS